MFFNRIFSAIEVLFDNSTNGFSSNEVQHAIEEAKQNAEGFPRAGISVTANGTVGNNQWIGPTELLPNTPMITSPVKLKIKEISWANQNTDVQFHIEFRKGSKTGTIFHTITVNVPNNGYGFENGLDYSIEAGEVIFAQYKDDGQNCSDLNLVIWVSRVN